MKQVPDAPKRKGTIESCSFCGKKFAPDYSPSRKVVHYVFRVRTKYATFFGPTHGNCVTRLRELQLPGVTE